MQLWKMNRETLLNEPYVNEVTLTEQNFLQSCKLAKLEDDPIIPDSNPGHTHVVQLGPGAEFFQISNFNSI